MRQETNNEIDVLLRRLSRRQGVPGSDAESHNDSDHLDADELSSYAENALPAAARARYTEHLAECSRCREIVVRLSASVPVVAARETVTAAAPSGLRKFLASLFSPMVLRYAVPALGLIVVAAIGFVALRSSSRKAESVARLNDSAQSRPTLAASEQPGAAATGLYTVPEQTNSPSSYDAPARKAETPREETKAVAPRTQAEVTDKVEAKKDEPAQTADRQAVANAAPAAPVTTPQVDEMQVNVEGKKANEQGRLAPASKLELAKQKAADDAKEQPKRADTTTAAARRPAKEAASPQAGSGSGFMVQERERERDKDAGVIRSAGGRRFRRQNGMWVDTAYESGKAIVDVTRGSEQFRALVADEPTIKSIADELDGTIVLVWKGRTYRIR